MQIIQSKQNKPGFRGAVPDSEEVAGAIAALLVVGVTITVAKVVGSACTFVTVAELVAMLMKELAEPVFDVASVMVVELEIATDEA